MLYLMMKESQKLNLKDIYNFGVLKIEKKILFYLLSHLHGSNSYLSKHIIKFHIKLLIPIPIITHKDNLGLIAN